MLNKVEAKMRLIAKRSWNKHVHGLPQKWVSPNLGEQKVIFEDGSVGRYFLTSNLLGEPCISEVVDGELTSGLFPLRWFNLPTTWEEVDALF